MNDIKRQIAREKDNVRYNLEGGSKMYDSAMKKLRSINVLVNKTSGNVVQDQLQLITKSLGLTTPNPNAEQIMVLFKQIHTLILKYKTTTPHYAKYRTFTGQTFGIELNAPSTHATRQKFMQLGTECEILGVFNMSSDKYHRSLTSV